MAVHKMLFLLFFLFYFLVARSRSESLTGNTTQSVEPTSDGDLLPAPILCSIDTGSVLPGREQTGSVVPFGAQQENFNHQKHAMPNK